MTPIVVIVFFDYRINTRSYSDHPKELGYIVSTVVRESTKDDQDVVGIQVLGNLVSLLFIRSHSFTNSGDMGIVPSVVIYDYGSVRHTGDLITVIPPTHDLGISRSILLDPVIGLSKIIDNIPLSVIHSSREDDRWGTVGL